MDQKNKIIHKRSAAILDNGKAKLPTKDQLEYGELAINFAKGVETISFKNNNDEIVEITTSTALEGVIESNMQSVQASIDAIYQVIEDNEEIVATSLTDLDNRVNLNNEAIYEMQTETAALETRVNAEIAKKADKTIVETLSGRVDANENAIANLQGFDDAYKGADNVVRDEFAAADSALESKLNAEIAKKADKTTVETLAGRVDTNEGAIKNLVAADTKIREDFTAADAQIVIGYTAAVIELEGRVNTEIAKKADKTAVEALDTRVTELSDTVLENEYVTAHALTVLEEGLRGVQDDITAADAALKSELSGELNKKVNQTDFEALADRVDANEDAITNLQGFDKAYKDADAKIREDFVAADTALETKLNGEIAKKADKTSIEALGDRLNNLEEGIIDNELVIAATITDLNDRLNEIPQTLENANVALKTELNTEIAKKADKSTVETLSGRVDTIQGTDSTKSMRTVAAEEAAKEVAKVVAEADADFDTLKEIADWILNDKTGAAALQNDVASLKNVVNGYTGKGAIKTAVDALGTRVETAENAVSGLQTTVTTMNTEIRTAFANADTALKNELTTAINKKADAATITSIDDRVTTLYKEVEDNEEAIATVITDLDERLINTLAIIEENEEITANLFAEMDTKIIDIIDKLNEMDVDGGEF